MTKYLMATVDNFPEIEDKEKISKSLKKLKQILLDCGCEVFQEEVLGAPGKEGVTLMLGRNKIFIPSNTNEKKETSKIDALIKKRNFITKRIPSDALFGGEADIMVDSHHSYLGFGTTTSERSGPFLVRLFNKPFIRYELKNGSLRDSFLFIGKNRVVIHKENFTPESYKEIKRRFSAVIELEKKDMDRGITNSILVNKKLVTTARATKKFNDLFKKEDIELKKIDISEFEKHGIFMKDLVLELV